VKLGTMVRIARDKWFSRGMRELYWTVNAMGGEIARLFERDNREFARCVLRDQWRYVTGTTRPVRGEIDHRIRAAVQWLLRAQQAGPDEGVPVGYFPCRRDGAGWMPSYPETTGCIITTLLAYAGRYDEPAARDAALRMARWEMEVQMSNGAVQGGPVCPPARQTAAAFNTGMVLDGWCSALQSTRAAEFLDAARRAADFLAGDVDENGYFRTNGAFVSAGEIKVYSCLCAWALYRYGDVTGERRYRDVAIAVIEAALRQQQQNGWFAHNCLSRSDAPLTHTIGYTLQGVLEVGLLARRQDFVEAARLGIDPIVARIDRTGYLPGRFYADWEPAAFSSCLTGNAQIAIVCYRLHEETGLDEYRSAADLLTNFLKALQVTDSSNPALNGAIAGSFPLYGEYMRAGYPNWSTKYFIDTLLIQARLDGERK
jgi:hypothetical protein